MGMVKVPSHEVIDVIAVRHSRMSAVRSVNVYCVVAIAVVSDAPVRICARDLDDMLVVVVFMGAMKVPVVKVSHMVPVPNRYVTAARAMIVFVVFVDGVGHDLTLLASGMNGCGRIGVVEDVTDERLHMGIRQAVVHIPPVASARDQVLFQEDPQSL